jgi:hypothetical protein
MPWRRRFAGHEGQDYALYVGLALNLLQIYENKRQKSILFKPFLSTSYPHSLLFPG